MVVDAELARLVWRRARGCCEYCQMPQECDERSFEIDHIISLKHRGLTVAENLALSCYRCNSFKGPDISGLTPHTRKLTPLFNPRRHRWASHFRWQGARLIGRTAIGRVTVHVLRINEPDRVKMRSVFMVEGVFPPARLL